MTYKSILATRRGTVDALAVVENELRPPSAGEARIRVLAASVTQDDVAVRVGNRPVLPKLPFVPGYSIIGDVDAVGEGVHGFAVGDRVGALTQVGGYTEVIYLDEKILTRVPAAVNPVEAMPLLLNYLVAYQTLHRVAGVRPGDRILIIGASGGCGTAYLDLGRLAGLKMYGLASAGKHPLLTQFGAIPIDYRTQDFVTVIRQAEPDGIEYVFNGMADEYFGPGLAVLRRGGALVHYGGPQSLWGLVRLAAKLIGANLIPNGKSIKGYGTHRIGLESMNEDWATLFRLLEAGQIRPVIDRTFPLLEAAEANRLLESGRVAGNLVLVVS
jgi:NADPH:quinone reductase-like Zn-dependent oxidoreductase